MSTRVVNHPGREFAFDVTLDLVKGAELFKQKPPLHFHVSQDEYFQVLEGTAILEYGGQQHELSKDSPPFTIRAWENHRTYPLRADQGKNIVRFLLSADQIPQKAFKLNTLFFENWYRYQEEVIMNNGTFSLLQILSVSSNSSPTSYPANSPLSQTFDAGGTYLAPPLWLPFGRTLVKAMSIVVGRWLGGALGYQPFYHKYSTDWNLACEEMQTCFFQRRFAEHSKND